MGDNGETQKRKILQCDVVTIYVNLFQCNSNPLRIEIFYKL